MSLRRDLSARVAEIALAVKFTDVPRSFGADAVDGSDKISVGNGVSRLFKLPQIFAQTGDCRRRIEYYFGAVQSQAASAFRKMPVVANVNADTGERRVKHG